MKSFLNRISILFLVPLLVIGLSGCTKKKLTNETFVINVGTEPPTLDWSKATDTTSSLCLQNLMEGLVQYDWNAPGIGVKPALAESFTISPDAKIYTYKLRSDVKWTDGKPLIAQHFVDSWRRLVDPKTASEYAYFIFDVKNAHAINLGEKPTTELGAVALDDHTLQVTLEQPASYFKFVPTHPPTFPIRLDVIEKYGDKWTEPGNIVTIGPFKLKEWVHDKKIVFERNDQYYGEKPKVQTIVGQMIVESPTALALFENGQLDYTQEVPPLDLVRYQKNQDLSTSLQTGPLFSNYYYGFNTKKAPFDNPNVRKAFAAAVDRNELLKVIRRDHYPLLSWIPVGMLGYNANIGIPFSPQKAKEYMIAAGYVQKDGKWVKASDGTPFPKVNMTFNANTMHQIVAENLQTQWRKSLGVEPEIEFQEWKVYLRNLHTDPPQIWRLGWVADYPDPDNFMALFYSYSSQNNTRWGNPEYDNLVKRAAGELDPEIRKALYEKAQRILTEEDVPIIPLFTTKNYFLLKPYVKGFEYNPMEVRRFSGVWLERNPSKKN